jgi:hypothetical protein
MSNQIEYDKDPATDEPIARLQGRFRMADLVTILSQLEKQTGKMPAAVASGGIDVIPIVSAETGEPRVEMQSDEFDKPIQLGYAEGFALAHALIEVTAQAVNDAVLFGFLHTQLGIEREMAAQMLHSMRGYRDQLLGHGNGAGDEQT